MKKISNLGKVLTKHQQQSIIGGYDCKQEYEYDCSVNPNQDPDLQCCSGLNCEWNATNTGTICVPPR